jgi:hypothetical protein
MRAAQSKKNLNLLISQPKKFFAGGGKKKKIDPKLKDFDLIFIGGLNTANMIKWFQHKHFHGTMAGFCQSNKFYYETLYPQVVVADIKIFKYGSMGFGSNYDSISAKYGKESVKQILPDKNQIVTENGDTYNYKSLVLNTGLYQKNDTMPFLKPYIMDDWAKTRVFVQELNNIYHINRNMRLFITHTDGDYLIYLPDGPSRIEANDQWYLWLDTYLSRGQFTENRSRGQRIKVITPRNYLFKFPFANDIIQDEISKRSMIGKLNISYKIRCSLWNGAC